MFKARHEGQITFPHHIKGLPPIHPIPPVFLPRRVLGFVPTSQHSPVSAVQTHKARTAKAVQGPRYPRYSVPRLGLFLQENNLRSTGVQTSGCCRSSNLSEQYFLEAV